MSEPQEIAAVDKSDLVGLVAELFAENYRLVQIGCSTLPDAYELTYSFDREYRFKNLRFTVVEGEEVPSISVIYPGAFLYENEIHDLFGVNITHIAVDYRGTLYRTALNTPFSVSNVKLPAPPQRKVPAAAEKVEKTETATGPADTPVDQA